MKKIYLSAILLFGLFSSGCNSVFELDNEGRLTREQIFSDYSLSKAYLSKCYVLMPNFDGMVYGGSFLDAYTDDAHDSNDVLNGNPERYYSGLMTSSNHALIDNIYSRSWETIRKCNVFIANIDRVPVMFIESERNQWKGEALTMRAYVYWNLIKRYGPLPIIKEELPRDFDYSNQTRSTFYDCVKSIIADCDLALEQPDLPWRIEVSGARGYMHKGLAVAIKSEAMLYAASPLWDPSKLHAAEAATITKQCLELLVSKGYGIYNPAIPPTSPKSFSSYQTYFLLEPDMVGTPVDNETIFADRSRIGEVWKQHGFPTSAMANTTKAGNCPTQELVDAYETSDGVPVLDPLTPYSSDHLTPNYATNGLYDPTKPYLNRDPRFYSTVFHNESTAIPKEGAAKYFTYVGVDANVPNGNAAISVTDQRSTRTGYYLRKFVHYESVQNTNKDGFMRIFRMAEMYLNYAEAEFYANGVTPEAIAAVGKVRERVGLPAYPPSISAAEFEARLRNERRVEFAFESHRFYDVRRWKILDKTENTVTGMKVVKQTNGTYTYERITVRETPNMDKDKYLIRPLPFSEQKIYEKYGIEFQNPGW